MASGSRSRESCMLGWSCIRAWTGFFSRHCLGSLVLVQTFLNVWVLGVIDLQEYHYSMFAIGLHALPGKESTDWSVEDWKRVAWNEKSRFQLLNANGRLRIGCPAHEAMDPAFQVGTV
ncbi:hypothetical protein TNCV_4472781 [Trichonephila clavipes]|uniref:Uncharacterized protein n=1 Tax=Trichonephila clavipes TaxID=2585209 RepID=A0A8X6SHH8_TRICX|nr:hypothetical protein TNCV_4472781 [Trichonephila clavipes]